MATPASTPADRAMIRLSRRIGRYAPTPAWSPPALSDLIARIDLAVAERRAG